MLVDNGYKQLTRALIAYKAPPSSGIIQLYGVLGRPFGNQRCDPLRLTEHFRSFPFLAIPPRPFVGLRLHLHLLGMFAD